MQRSDFYCIIFDNCGVLFSASEGVAMKAISSSLVLEIVAVSWLVLVIWLIFLSSSIRKINKREKAIAKASENGDFITSVESSLNQLAAMQQGLEMVKADHAALATTLQGAVQRVGLVRFDAFEDTGGRLSFATALLDNHGDGVVISAINGRQEGRSYAKTIKNGNSEHNLSEEELQAIAEALNGTKVFSRV